MKVKVMIEVDIDEKQYDDTYCDYYESNKQMLDDMKTDITANAQSGILQWAERLHFDIKIKDNIVEGEDEDEDDDYVESDDPYIPCIHDDQFSEE